MLETPHSTYRSGSLGKQTSKKMYTSQGSGWVSSVREEGPRALRYTSDTHGNDFALSILYKIHRLLGLEKWLIPDICIGVLAATCHSISVKALYCFHWTE